MRKSVHPKIGDQAEQEECENVYEPVWGRGPAKIKPKIVNLLPLIRVSGFMSLVAGCLIINFEPLNPELLNL